MEINLNCENEVEEALIKIEEKLFPTLKMKTSHYFKDLTGHFVIDSLEDYYKNNLDQLSNKKERKNNWNEFNSKENDINKNNLKNKTKSITIQTQSSEMDNIYTVKDKRDSVDKAYFNYKETDPLANGFYNSQDKYYQPSRVELKKQKEKGNFNI